MVDMFFGDNELLIERMNLMIEWMNLFLSGIVKITYQIYLHRLMYIGSMYYRALGSRTKRCVAL